jgi:hypothetical protein
MIRVLQPGAMLNYEQKKLLEASGSAISVLMNFDFG